MRVPLVVVTGFLGAGKTTLVNRLLADRAAKGAEGRGKLGVIVNELGEIGIDGALLGSDATRQIELPGGCVCCVLGDELDQTLIELVTKNPGLDAIVLETTGVAEPLPIAWAVRRDPVQQHVRLAMVVTLVDATNFRASRDVSVAVAAQVAYADVLLVTKAEIAGEAETTAAINEARGLAPKAQILHGTTEAHARWLEQVLADPDLEHVPGTHVGHGEPQRGEPQRGEPHRGEPHRGWFFVRGSDAEPGHVHDDSCRDGDSHAAHGIDSTWLDVEGPVDLEELEDQLAELPANYVRIKGIVRESEKRWAAIHRVGLRVSSEPFVRKPDDFFGDNGRIVALGKDLDAEKLADCLRAAYLK